MLPPMRLLRWFVARRAISATSRGEALDLGCGPGLLVLELARRAPDLRVTGIDLSERMVSAAQERARVRQASRRVSFIRADVQLVPLPDSSMDLVLSTLSLHHWSDPVSVLDEIARQIHSLIEGFVLQFYVILEKLLPPDVTEDEPEAHDYRCYENNFHSNLLGRFCFSFHMSIPRHFCFTGGPYFCSIILLQHFAHL